MFNILDAPLSTSELLVAESMVAHSVAELSALGNLNSALSKLQPSVILMSLVELGGWDYFEPGPGAYE